MNAARVTVIATVLAVMLMAFGTGPAFSAPESGDDLRPVAIIVNPSNDVGSLSVDDISKIYTNNLLKWPDGTPIRIYDLVVNNPQRLTFSSAVLDKTPDRVAEEWAHLKITNQAKNPPHVIKSEALIIKRVARERGAIGYVTLKRVEGLKSVRVVATLD